MLLFSMCILFFNNKIKLDKLTDVMSSKINKNVKPDTKIIIPENFIGLIYYKDCYLNSLQSGEYKLNESNFPKVIKKNERRNRKRKKENYNFNIHFINTNTLSISFEFKAITSFKQKSKYFLTATYSISNPKTFANELLITWYKTTNNRTLSYIKSWFKDFSSYLIKKLDASHISNDEYLKDFSNKFFKKYGIYINSISLNTNKSNFFTTNSSTQKQEIQEQSYITHIQEKPTTNEIFCPKCQAKIINGSKFCVRCGEKIIDKTTKIT